MSDCVRRRWRRPASRPLSRRRRARKRTPAAAAPPPAVSPPRPTFFLGCYARHSMIVEQTLVFFLLAACLTLTLSGFAGLLPPEGMWRPLFLSAPHPLQSAGSRVLLFFHELLGAPIFSAASGGAMVGLSFGLMLLLVGWRSSMVDMVRGALHMRPIPLCFIIGCGISSFYLSPISIPIRPPTLAILVGGFLSGFGAISACPPPPHPTPPHPLAAATHPTPPSAAAPQRPTATLPPPRCGG